MKPSTEWWRYLAPLAVIAIIALIPVPAGLESHTWLYFAVFTGVIVGLILEPVPGPWWRWWVSPLSPFSRRGCCLARSSSPNQVLSSPPNPLVGGFWFF
ncbi:anion permease [Escherichia coli]|nr:anion permease [Escherichia coli]